MSIEKFVIDFANAVEVDPESIDSTTVFKDLDNWDSMAVLTVIAMIDDEYKKSIGGDALNQAKTISDLWAIIQG
jgi:acyl carrier protein